MFGSSKKTQVYTSTMRVLDDEQIPDTPTESLIQAIIGNQGIADTIIENFLNGGVVNVDQLYRYGESDYVHGLPNADVVTVDAGQSIAKDIIEAEIGAPITINYFEFRPLANTHIGWQTITEDYGYNHDTNELESLTATVGYPVYLDDLVAVHTQEIVDEAEPGVLDPVGPAGTAGFTPERPASNTTTYSSIVIPTPYEVGDEEGVRVDYVWDTGERVYDHDAMTSERVLGHDSLFISVNTMDLEQQYYQVGYQSGAGRGYWTYMFDAGTHPELDALYDMDDVTIGTYFPFVFFRNEKKDLTREEVRDTEAFKTSERLLGFLDLDYVDIGKEIHENPDIGDVEQAYMMLGISANSTHQADLHYLYEFFERLFQSTPDPEILPSGWHGNGPPRNRNALRISDTHFLTTLSYGGIHKRRVAGKLGIPGTYGTRTDTLTTTVLVRVFGGAGEGQYTWEEQTVEVPQRIYQKQINNTFYEELIVNNPTLRYDIYRRYSHTTEVGDEQLLIPLDKSITDTFTLIEREEIYFRSLHFVFNSRVTETVSWYESGLFSFVLVVVAVVLTVISAGAAWGPLAAAAATSFTALTWAVVQMIVKIAVYNYSFRLVVREIGVENAFIAAIVTAVAAMYLGTAHPGALENAPWAPDLLLVSNGLLQGVDFENRRLIGNLEDDFAALEETKTEAQEEIDRAMELLDPDSLMDPFAFIGLSPLNVPGEEPDDFYNRTIHAGNIGIIGIDAVSSYVDNSLKLPTMNSTLGDTFHV